MKRTTKSTDEDLNFIYSCCKEVLKLDLSKKSKQTKYVRSRLIYYRLAKDHTKCSLSEIGSLAGGRDHATVRFNISNFENDILKDKFYKKKYLEIERICAGVLTESNRASENEGEMRIIELIRKNANLITEIEFLKIELSEAISGGDEIENKLLSIFRQFDFNQKTDALFKLSTILKVGKKLNGKKLR